MDAATNLSDRHGSGHRAARMFLSIIIAALIAGAGVLLARHELLFVDTIDRFLGDWRTAALSPRAGSTRPDIAVVLITEETLLDYPARSPIDRGLMADLISAIDSARPKAIGLDLIFDRKSAQDETFLAALNKARSPIVLGAIDERIAVPPQSMALQEAFLRQANKPVGHLLFLRKKGKLTGFDNAVRLVAPTLPAHANRPAFATVLANVAQNREPGTPYGDGSSDGDGTSDGGAPSDGGGSSTDGAPSDGGGSTMSQIASRLVIQAKRPISWLLPPTDAAQPLFLTLKVPQHKPGARAASFNEIFPQSWRDLLRDRVVLIGGGMLDMDGHITPLSIRDGNPVVGVFIHAQALAQRLDGNRDITTLTELGTLLAVFLVAFLCFQLGRSWNVRKYEKSFQFLGLVILGGISLGMFWLFRLTIPSGAMTFAWLIGAIAGHYSGPLFRRLGLGG